MTGIGGGRKGIDMMRGSHLENLVISSDYGSIRQTLMARAAKCEGTSKGPRCWVEVIKQDKARLAWRTGTEKRTNM